MTFTSNGTPLPSYRNQSPSWRILASELCYEFSSVPSSVLCLSPKLYQLVSNKLSSILHCLQLFKLYLLFLKFIPVSDFKLHSLLLSWNAGFFRTSFVCFSLGWTDSGFCYTIELLYTWIFLSRSWINKISLHYYHYTLNWCLRAQ